MLNISLAAKVSRKFLPSPHLSIHLKLAASLPSSQLFDKDLLGGKTNNLEPELIRVFLGDLPVSMVQTSRSLFDASQKHDP